MTSEAKKTQAPSLPLDDLWEHEEPVQDFGIEVPEWIKGEVTPSDVAAIVQGGCASGAYMPAVTYHEARETMNRHGDAVTYYIADYSDPLEYDPVHESWSGFCVRVLSLAVEIWASNVEAELTQGG